jgi:hypothetical protein
MIESRNPAEMMIWLKIFGVNDNQISSIKLSSFGYKAHYFLC